MPCPSRSPKSSKRFPGLSRKLRVILKKNSSELNFSIGVVDVSATTLKICINLMMESVVAAMDFNEKEMEVGKLMKNGSNSEGIQNDQEGMNVVLIASASEAKYNSKNAVRSDGFFRKYICEKGSFTSELRLGLAFEDHCAEEKGLPSWIRTVNGGAMRSVAQCIPRPLDLSVVGSCSNSINLFPNQSGFGSPIAVMGGFDHRTSSYDHQDGCAGFRTSFRPAASTIPGRRSGAQLTIFYCGTVNVYDEIPSDKAQAIMLTASSGNHSRYPLTNVQNICRWQTELQKSLPVMSYRRDQGSTANLLFARCTQKHSLQRFLETRKERLNANAKSPYTATEADNTKPQRHPSSSMHSNSLL